MTALRRMTGRIFGKALGGSAAALALALAAPAAAQNSEAPVDVTAAPPPSAETVGPSQLRDFNLQGTVTRPSDRPATTTTNPAQPTPPSGDASTATANAAPASQPGRAPSNVRSTASSAAPAATSNVPIADSVATPSTPLDVTTEAAPAQTYEPPADSTSSPTPSVGETWSWPWIAALLALVAGAAFVAWSRRGRRSRYADPGRMAFAGLAPDIVPDATPVPRPRPDPVPPRAQPVPGPAPVPAPKPAPAPAPPPRKDDGLIVSRSLKPELNVQFEPDRAVVTENEVLVQFDVLLVNSGSAPARDVLVEGKLVSAHAGQDQEIAAFFQNPVGQGDRIAAIPPLGRVSLKSVVRLPISQLHSFEAAGRKLFVPLVAFNILFRSSGGEGHASASFLIGRGNEEDEKLAPFRLDLGPRVFRGLSARPHSMGLQKVA